MIENFTLGCAQLDPSYGVRRQALETKQDPVELIERAIELGVRSFDTAQAYPESEKILGSVLKRHTDKFFVSTKLHPNITRSPGVMPFILTSCEVLGQTIDSFMFHRDRQYKDKTILHELIEAKEAKLINGIGYSCEKRIIWDICDEPFINHIQLPFNLANINMNNWLLPECTDKRISLRSIFLQGRLSLGAHDLAKFNHQEFNVSRLYHSLIKKHFPLGDMERLPRLLALSFARLLCPTADLVIGVDSIAELEDLIEMLKAPPRPVPFNNREFLELSHAV